MFCDRPFAFLPQMSVSAPIELDADSLERVLQLVSDSGLLRAAHTARLVDKSWNQAVNSRTHRLREASNNGGSADLSALLQKTPNLSSLDIAYSSITPAACRQLYQLQLKELCIADCTELEPSDLAYVRHLTRLQVLKLSHIRSGASAVLESCANLRRLHTLELRDFKSIDEKLFAKLTPLTKLKTLAVVAEDISNATLRSLSMHLLPSCAPNLTSLELGKVESTYPLAALRELSQLQVLSLTNCKLFLKPDNTGHDLLVEVAHLTQLSSLSLRQFATQSVHSAQLHQDMRQLKGLRCLHVEQGRARGFIEGLTALTGLDELVLLDELTEIQSRNVLNELLLSLFHLTCLELSVRGDVLVEGFRLFRHLPFLQKLKFAGPHSFDTKGVSNLFWGLTSLTGTVTSLSLRGAKFSAAIQGRYRTGAGASVHDLDLGEFPVHSLQVFANVFPEARSLCLILVCFQQLPLQSWTKLTHLSIDWQPHMFSIDSDCPLAMCESLSKLPLLRRLTVECPASSVLGTNPFATVASKHQDMLRLLPGVDVIVVQYGSDLVMLSS